MLYQTAIDWVHQYGYFALFALQALGVFALPLPDEMLVTFAGYLCYTGDLRLPLTITAATLGASCGVTFSYLLGSLSGHLVARWAARLLHVTPERMKKVHEWFERSGRWTLVFGYYLPGIRHLIGFTAGATRLQFHIFALYAYFGTLLWSCVFVFLGFSLGQEWQQSARQVHLIMLAVAAAIAIAILAFAWRWRRTH